MFGSASLIREAARKANVRVAPAQAAPAPLAASAPQPAARRAVYQPLPPHGIYKDLMRSHDRVHTRHLRGNDIYRPGNI